VNNQTRKTSILDKREYREKPEEYFTPTGDELRARNKRNVALAIGLLLFMVFVFVTMITRASGATG